MAGRHPGPHTDEGELLRMDGERFNDKPFQFKFRAGDIKPAWARP